MKAGMLQNVMSMYLWTNGDLRREGSYLGKMTEGDYQSFLERAKGLGFPAIGITIEFQPGKGNDQPYPITAEEWDIFVGDIPYYTREEPEVWAYDSEKWALPI